MLKKNEISKSLFTFLIFSSYIVSIFSVTSVPYFIFNSFIAVFSVIIPIIFILKENKIRIEFVILTFLIFFLIIVTRRLESVALMSILYLSYIYNDDLNKDYITLFFKVSLFCFVFIIIANKIFNFNIQQDGNIWRNSLDGTYGDVYRYSLGFTHPNQASIKWIEIVISGSIYFYINNSKKLFYFYSLLISIASYYVLSQTQSRTVMYIIPIYICTCIFVYKNNYTVNVVLLKYFPWIYLSFSLFIVTLHKNTIISNFLSGRPVFYYRYLKNYGINIFGNEYLDKYGGIDNSYIHMLLTKGVVFFIIYTLVISIFFKNIKRIKLFYAISLATLFTVAIFETMLIKFDIVILILFITKLNLFNSNSDLKKY